MSVSILLPVKAHVKIYLEKTHGKIMDISERGVIPFLLYRMLEKHKKQDPGIIKPSQKLIDHRLFFPYEVFIGEKVCNTRGMYLGSYDIQKFNSGVDEMIREEMFRWCHHPNATDDVVDYNIQRFCEYYGFSEDDLPFANLKRWYYRERERIQNRSINIKEFVPQMVLSF
jgi:hypothetical protein